MKEKILKTHLDKQIEFIREQGIIVDQDSIKTMLNNKSYTDAIAQDKEETYYFIDSSYSDGLKASESHVSYRNQDYLIKGKTCAENIAQKLRLYHDMLQYTNELGGCDNHRAGTWYGIRCDYDEDPRGHLYVTSHTNINPFVFGIVFRASEKAELLLKKFETRIKLYY
jgi:hypothetical protein